MFVCACVCMIIVTLLTFGSRNKSTPHNFCISISISNVERNLRCSKFANNVVDVDDNDDDENGCLRLTIPVAAAAAAANGDDVENGVDNVNDDEPAPTNPLAR